MIKIQATQVMMHQVYTKTVTQNQDPGTHEKLPILSALSYFPSNDIKNHGEQGNKN